MSRLEREKKSRRLEDHAANPVKPLFTFTCSGQAAVEAAITEQVNHIAARIFDLVPDEPRSALLLCGGFGRGEGAARLSDGALEIQNDYDFELVFQTSSLRFVKLYRGLRRVLSPITRSLTQELGIKQIDLGIKNLDLLRRGPDTIALYEMANGHYQLAGDPEIASRLPHVAADRIPLTEGARLILNRGGGLLIAALYLQRDQSGWSALELKNFETELSKAGLAVGDLWLLQHGLYHYSYRTRARRLNERNAFRDRPEAARLYQRSLDYKLHWNSSIDPRGGAVSWELTRDLFLEAWRSFERDRLDIAFDDWDAYERIAKPRHEPLYLDLARGLVRPHRFSLARRRPRLWILSGHEAALLSTLPKLLLSYPGPGSADTGGAGLPETVRWTRAAMSFIRQWYSGGEAGRIAGADQ